MCRPPYYTGDHVLVKSKVIKPTMTLPHDGHEVKAYVHGELWGWWAQGTCRGHTAQGQSQLPPRAVSKTHLHAWAHGAHCVPLWHLEGLARKGAMAVLTLLTCQGCQVPAFVSQDSGCVCSTGWICQLTPLVFLDCWWLFFLLKDAVLALFL